MDVLVADDDPVFRKIMAGALTAWGHEPLLLEDGQSAWEVLQRPDAPRLVILDWEMPVISGPEICRRLRQKEHGRYTQIIMVTVHSQKCDVVDGIDSGADDYMIKPVDLHELQARLNAAIRSLQVHEDLLAARDMLDRQVNIDYLTGVRSRRAIMEMLSKELTRAARNGSTLGVALADLDGLKQVNDTLGHLAGDVILRETAQRMLSCLRPYDGLGRYGGDEFLVVVPDTDNMKFPTLSERLRRVVCERPIRVADLDVPQTITIGTVRALGPKGLDWKQVIRAADEALLQGKQEGRNRVGIAADTLAS